MPPPSLLTPPRTPNAIAPGVRCHLSLLYRFCLAWRRSTSGRNVTEIVLLYCYIKSFWNNTIPSYIATIARNFRREPGCLEIHHTTLEYPKWSWKDLMTFWHFSHKTGHRHYQHLRAWRWRLWDFSTILKTPLELCYLWNCMLNSAYSFMHVTN